MKLIFRF